MSSLAIGGHAHEDKAYTTHSHPLSLFHLQSHPVHLLSSEPALPSPSRAAAADIQETRTHGRHTIYTWAPPCSRTAIISRSDWDQEMSHIKLLCIVRKYHHSKRGYLLKDGPASCTIQKFKKKKKSLLIKLSNSTQ